MWNAEQLAGEPLVDQERTRWRFDHVVKRWAGTVRAATCDLDRVAQQGDPRRVIERRHWIVDAAGGLHEVALLANANAVRQVAGVLSLRPKPGEHVAEGCEEHLRI